VTLPHPLLRPRAEPAPGFSLVELMVTVAIVGVLAMIAVPGYRQYVERGNRSVAKTAMSEIVARQESHRSERKRYATTLRGLERGWQSGTLYVYRDGTLTNIENASAIYQVRLEGNAADTRCPPGDDPTGDEFTVVAEPIRTQASDTACATLCLSSAGVKGASGASGAECWRR
jgi:type IV pilus assembly protein PilE